MRELDLGAGHEDLGLTLHPGSHPGLRPARETGAARLPLGLPRLLGRKPARLREGLLPRGGRESPGGRGLAERRRLLPGLLSLLWLPVRLTGLWLTERLLSRLPLAVRRLVVRMRHAAPPDRSS
ncbi:hypothetical protein [Saccharomonospora iraqiensis]|uniref:hypothetical protein n=1 Tax=Saccharomonospora iraqiensis TaxID=52698 RepID=UPI000302BBB2|nr:hypothetical protein [Saccharomonospora iraqiensis]